MVRARRIGARVENAAEEVLPTTRTFWIRSWIGIALILLVAAVALLIGWRVREQAEASRQIEAGARAVAQAANAEIDRLRRRLRTLQTDPGLRDAFVSRDPTRLERAKKDLFIQLPGALGIYLVAPEETSSVEGIPYLSYVGLDLARQAAQERKTTAVEVDRVGTPDVRLAVASPVVSEDGQKAVGVIYLALPLSLLPNPNGAAGDRGILRYLQAVRNESAVVGEGPQVPSREPDHTEQVPNSRLQVAAWLTGADPFDSGPVVALASGYLVTLLLVGSVLWLGWRAQRVLLANEWESILSMVVDAVGQRPHRVPRPLLGDFRIARDKIAAALKILQPGRNAPPGSAANRAAAAAGGEPANDILGPSYLNELGVVEEQLGAPLDFEPSSEPKRDIPEQTPAGPLDSAGRTVFSPGLPSEARSSLELGEPTLGTVAIPPEIFRAYDIRGVAERQLTREAMREIGRALGTEAVARGDDRVILGRDCRATSPGLCAALAEGIRAAGLEVVDLGVVPTPLVYFACSHPEPHAGAMVTGSHNPPEYNGVKPLLAGQGLDAEQIQGLRARILRGDFSSGDGGYRAEDPISGYRDHVVQNVALARGLKVVVDCANATASSVAPDLYRGLGCEVIELNCKIGTGTDERSANPAAPELTRELSAMVLAAGADIGLGFDGDADRLGVVDSEGRFVPADLVLMLLATDVLGRRPGSDVVYDVKCSRHLDEEIRRAGGRPVMSRSGHTPIKAKMRECGAPIAGELSGHICFAERWFGFDDAIYGGARLLEVLSLDPRSSHEIFSALPSGVTTPELTVSLSEGEPAQVMSRVMEMADRIDGVNVIRVDGLRAEFERGWGLVRASNTEPGLSFRFEGDDQGDLERIQALFRRIMEKAAPGVKLPF